MAENDGSAERELVVNHWQRQNCCGTPGVPMGRVQSDSHYNRHWAYHGRDEGHHGAIATGCD